MYPKSANSPNIYIQMSRTQPSASDTPEAVGSTPMPVGETLKSVSDTPDPVGSALESVGEALKPVSAHTKISG